MGEQQIIANQFNRADLNHDGTIDEQEFRQFLGPVRNYNRLSANINYQDIQNLNLQASNGGQTTIYPIGLDVALAGFTENPINYERYTRGAYPQQTAHTYGLGSDVGIGAPNVARRYNQYDPAGVMFDYADINHDGRIDLLEFGTFLRSV
ncbi:unnamed protein product [Rotaria sordida]|uniref:EF-hand domain-containing protein n=1 Tax=Rotaria sordida TaxID=392033 RepID=A0A819Q922_9BILA|nr:unnamed protein product [Rotaria sordida]